MAKIQTIQPKQTSRWTVILFILAGLLLLSFALSSLISLFAEDRFGNVAHISVIGPISGYNGNLFSDVTVGSDIVELIEKADAAPEIKAIIIEVNSPGGAAVASSDIAEAVKRTNKTTVAVIKDVGASGGYWVASSADYVIANKMSITGSIGVIGSYLEFSGLLHEYNVSYERLVAGKYKDAGTPFKELTGEERALFQEVLDEIHDIFIAEVAQNRNMEIEDVRKIATGWIFTGMKAKELGLVDELGGMDSAITYIENNLNITVNIAEYKKKESLADLLSEVFSGASFSVGQGIGSSLTAQPGSVSIRT